MSYLEKYVFLKENTNSTMGNRVLAEIGYAHKLSKVNSCKFDDVISKVTEFLMEKYHADGNLTDAAAKEAESMLSVISGEAKKYRIMCTAHAHIDMNWMWDYPETVAITTDTFRTVLSLMKDFPGFKFSQSQASVYRIVEEHEPEMLDEIRKMVAAGRWEAVASTWVEADKNLTSGESQARHVLYTKRYLGTLLDISPESIQVDFEPDTFGHSANVPEILSQGGIRYYYHCRGYDGYNIYRWKAESGASLLVYREPVWYNEKIDSDMALFVPEFCEANGIDTLLKVYGVGNHGGGPTRRDLERITEMQTWPVFPEIVFGTYAEFFDHLEKTKKEFPEVTGELNYVFTGCYTSQSRIKKANKTSENRLVDSEALCSMASIGNNRRYNSAKFFGAWERVMFNQFHDILPGSGVIDTREFAMGNYQYAIAFANSEAADAIRTLTKDIDTSWISPQGQDEAETNSEGAGVGFDLCRHRIPATETGRGLNRIKHIFNPTQFRRKEPVETTIWDWPGDLKRLIVTDHKGNRIAHQLLDKAGIDYWAHNYVRILIDADILPYGFSTYHITQKEMEDIPISLPNWERLMDNDSFVLENEKICVRFNSQNLALESLFDKEIGRELIDSERKGGLFNLINEDTTKGMSSWVIGRYKKVTPIEENFVVTERNIDSNALRQWISFKGSFSDSTIKVTVSLDKGSSIIVYDTECDWHEKAEHKVTVQQLNFKLPLAGTYSSYRYDIPMGTIDRTPLEHDVPGLGFASAINEEGGVMIISSDRYGYRGFDNSLAITLIRNSTNPDPYPESGINRFRFGIASTKDTGSLKMLSLGNKFNHLPIAVSGLIHKGGIQPKLSLLEITEGNVCISAVKMAEDNSEELIIRLFEPMGEKQNVRLTFESEPINASFLDINELNKAGTVKIKGNSVSFEIEAGSIVTIGILFKN